MTQDEYRKYVFWLTAGVVVFVISRSVYEKVRLPKSRMMLNDPNRDLRQKYERITLEKEIAAAQKDQAKG